MSAILTDTVEELIMKWRTSAGSDNPAGPLFAALAIADGVRSALYETAHRKLCRVLILEVNAARMSGKLTAADPADRWSEFLALSGTPRYWESLGEHYPTMLSRLHSVVTRRCAAAAAMADRVAADRDALRVLTGEPPGRRYVRPEPACLVAPPQPASSALSGQRPDPDAVKRAGHDRSADRLQGAVGGMDASWRRPGAGLSFL